MFNDYDEELSFGEVVAHVPSNKWTWSILDFSGVGDAPHGMAMPAFEELVRSTLGGYRLSWRELHAFALGLHQVVDCTIVSAENPDSLIVDELDVDNFGHCAFVIQAFDSSRWVFRASTRVTTANHALVKLEASYLNRRL
ncbi:hypothetical protein ACRAKI_12875 [Saccharothrix isguenensis]